jgi:hypothetical protein
MNLLLTPPSASAGVAFGKIVRYLRRQSRKIARAAPVNSMLGRPANIAEEKV